MEANVFAALLVFNLGIVCHQTSLQQGGGSQSSSSSSSHAFNKARTLYEHSSQLLIRSGVTTSIASAEEERSSSSTGNAIVDLMHMSLLNNQAQLCVECSEYEMSLHLLGRLFRLAHNVKATLLPMHNATTNDNTRDSNTIRGGGVQNDDDGYNWMMQQVDSYLFNAVIAGLCPVITASAA
jgi:hypothetical protein